MLIDILSRIIFNIMLIVALYILEDRRIMINDKKFWISIAVINLLSFTCISLKIVGIKPFLNTIILVFTDVYVLRSKISNSIIKTIIVYSNLILMETIIILFIILVFDAYTTTTLNDILNTLNSTDLYSAIYNIVLSTILIMILKSKYIFSLYRNLVIFFNRISSKKNIFIACSVFILILLTYIVLNFSEHLFLNILMLITLLFIISIIYFKDLRIRFEYEETKEKYNSIQNSLVEYEDMIDKYRVSNHENKNQLLTIQNMINNKDNNINDYINNLVGTVYMNNEKTMMDVSIIPAGGLRATIHTKINVMDNSNIKYILNIDRKLRTIDFENINSRLNLKICKIISIFLDNAIDEVNNHDEEKSVSIVMYVYNDNLVIEISNRFRNVFDVNKIFEKKYTTKEKGHGYGLALAQELIDSENELNNSTKIEDDIFTQIIEIKLKH